MESLTSTAVTDSIRVDTQSFYVPGKSRPGREQYFFGYRIRITNEGPETVRLLSRHWVIEDGLGRTEEVRGPGVVGEQPVLEPGDHYEYTSACPLATRCGSMEGTYTMERGDEAEFNVQIGRFALICPHVRN
jgi:ApaG protein